MSQNSLIPADLTEGKLVPEGTFGAIVSGGDYLARLQLFSGKSDACQEGKIGIGHFGLVKDDQITDLGEEINVIIVTWRPKAVQTGGETLIIDFHPEIVDKKITNPTFKNIVEMSGTSNSGCMYGPEYLVWIPSVSQFATYHMNSKTARREARNMEPLHGQAATLKCKLIETAKFKWHGPVVIPCSTPLDLPPDDELRNEFTKFQNPPRNEVETAPEDSGEERAR